MKEQLEDARKRMDKSVKAFAEEVSRVRTGRASVALLDGIKVDYNPEPEDPENANGYIEQNGGVISSCVRWRWAKMRTS